MSKTKELAVKPEVKILVGIPGCGKTTYAMNLVRSDPTWVRVSRDDCRATLTGNDFPGAKYETLVDTMMDSVTDVALKKGFNVVIDNTHCRMQSLKDTIMKWSKKATVKVHIVGSELSLKQIKEQNTQRVKVVPEEVIDNMHKGFRHILSHKAEVDEFITEMSTVIEPSDTTFKQDVTKKKAIIVDIDGTVAKMGDVRGPFDWHKVYLDKPVHEVLNIVRSLSPTYEVIFMSGRDEAARELTEAWLTAHYGQEFKLYMRGKGDARKDCIVKEELFMKHVEPYYYVECALDDRDQVVALWRNTLGIKCLQVDYGSF